LKDLDDGMNDLCKNKLKEHSKYSTFAEKQGKSGAYLVSSRFLFKYKQLFWF